MTSTLTERGREAVDLDVARAVLGPDVKRDGFGVVYVDTAHNGGYVVVTTSMLVRALQS
jgi:hypothetical protein